MILKTNKHINIFIELSKVYDLRQTVNKLFNNFNHSNIEQLKTIVDVDSFVNEYCNLIKDKKRNYQKRRNIEAYRLDIMLQSGTTSKQVAIIESKVIKQLGIPVNYISFKVTDVVDYLVIIILDRYYYDKPKLMTIRATSDWWVDEKQIRRKEEEPNVKLKFKKGQIIKKRRVKISDKIRIFNFANEQEFTNVMYSLKMAVARVYYQFKYQVTFIPYLFKKRSYKLRNSDSEGNWFAYNKQLVLNDQQYYYYYRKIREINNVYEWFNSNIVTNSLFRNEYVEHKNDVQVLIDKLNKLYDLNKIRSLIAVFFAEKSKK